MSAKETIVPPVLYLPIERVAGSDEPQTPVAKLADGRKAIFAFTALDRLADCCGRGQEWALIPTESLGSLQAELGFEVVSMDKPVPEIRAVGGTTSYPTANQNSAAGAGSRVRKTR